MKPLRQILHIDMDAFYASVEQRDDPALKGRPVIVGGSAEHRGVVSAASYEARTFGIHSAMPMAQAVKRCSYAVVLPVRMAHYAGISRQIRAIFERYTPLIEPISLDEAFLDVTGSERLFGDACQIGHTIKQQIKDELDLTASVGVAPNKFLAKVGSDLDKPDGFVIITEENKQQVLDPLPVRRIWGIGKVTQRILEQQGIRTVAQLRAMTWDRIHAVVGDSAATLQSLAQGLDDRPVETEGRAKSISSEQTFATDIADREALLQVLLEQVERVATRLRAQGLQARTVTLKFRYGDFRTLTRRKTLDHTTDLTEDLWQAAQDVFLRWQRSARGALRLLGFGVSGLSTGTAVQLELFPDPQAQKLKRLDRAVDQIKERYGGGAIHRNG
jgi:DNA polymerase IV